MKFSRPQGFEFYDRRSTKSGKGSDWRGVDALYDASQIVPSDCKTLAVAWVDSAGKTNYRCAGESDSVIALLTRTLHDRL